MVSVRSVVVFRGAAFCPRTLTGLVQQARDSEERTETVNSPLIKMRPHLHRRIPLYSPTRVVGTSIYSVVFIINLGVPLVYTFRASLLCQQAANRARCILFQFHPGIPISTQEMFPPMYLALVRSI